MTIKSRVESRDLGAPGHRLGVVFFFGRLGENAAGFDGIGVDVERLPGKRIGGFEVAVLKLAGGLGEKARFVPATPPFARRRKTEKADSKPENDKKGDEEGAANLKPLFPGKPAVAFAAHTLQLLGH